MQAHPAIMYRSQTGSLSWTLPSRQLGHQDGSISIGMSRCSMSWASDDLGVESEVSQLGSVFRDLYRYSVEYFKIP